jgi:hypothetical protein
MPISNKSLLAFGCLTAIVLMAACSPRRIPPVTVTDLMEDRVALDGLLMKCNQDPAKARSDADCQTARIAVERLASKQTDPAEEAKRQAEFERSREQLRLVEDKRRAEEEAKKPKVDVYNMPVLPVDATPPKDQPPQKDSQSAIVGQTKP